jgi:hypothetical protein
MRRFTFLSFRNIFAAAMQLNEDPHRANPVAANSCLIFHRCSNLSAPRHDRMSIQHDLALGAAGDGGVEVVSSQRAVIGMGVHSRAAASRASRAVCTITPGMEKLTFRQAARTGAHILGRTFEKMFCWLVAERNSSAGGVESYRESQSALLPMPSVLSPTIHRLDNYSRCAFRSVRKLLFRFGLTRRSLGLDGSSALLRPPAK